MGRERERDVDLTMRTQNANVLLNIYVRANCTRNKSSIAEIDILRNHSAIVSLNEIPQDGVLRSSKLSLSIIASILEREANEEALISDSQ